MKLLVLSLVLTAAALPVSALPLQHSDAPIDIRSGPSPQPVTAGSKRHLIYELHISNVGRGAVDLNHLTVTNDVGRHIAELDTSGLSKVAAPVGEDESEHPLRTVQAGRTIELFMDVEVASTASFPRRLHHRLQVDAHWRDGTVTSETVGDIVVQVSAATTPVLRAPLTGSTWVAVNALSAPHHRRAVAVVDGRARIAQRFAIDWVRLGLDGRAFHGDPKINANYYGYGANVLAVADGRVVAIKDGVPENAGSERQRAVPITLENLAGNHLILDIGGGRFCVFAHLQPGHFVVKVGDRVRAGQLLAKVGNSGAADLPHLHFHMVDAPSNLGAEGIPYELALFSQLGTLEDVDGMVSGQAWMGAGSRGRSRTREFPVDNAVLALP